MEVTHIGYLKSCNEWVAVSPPLDTGAKLDPDSVKSGFGVQEQKNTLLELTALAECPSLGIKAGDSVFFNGDVSTRPEAKRVFTVGDQRFVLFNKALVVAFRSTWSAQ